MKKSLERRDFNPASMRGCVLYLPFHKYGANQSKIWDQSVQMYGPNLATNGTMESGNPPTGWVSAFTPETFEQSSVQKYSGSYSAHVNDSTPSGGGFRSSGWNVYPSKTYRISFKYYIVSGVLKVGFTSGGGDTTYTTTGSWQSGEIIAKPVMESGLGVCFTNNSASVAAEFYIDDVAVQEVGYNAGINDGTITGAVPSSYPRVSSVELVPNNTMEADSGWQPWNPSQLTTYERSAVDKYSGTYSRHIVTLAYANYAGEATAPYVSTVVGKKYKVTAWIRWKSGDFAGIFAWDATGGYRFQSVPKTDAWAYCELTFTATETSTAVGIAKSSTATITEFYYDEVYMKEIQGYQSLGWNFDGTDDKVNCGSDESISVQSSFTVCAWVRPTKAAGLNGILWGRIGSGATTPYWVLRDNDPTPNFQFNIRGDGGGEPKCSSTTPSTPDIWKCVIGVRDTVADKLKIFVNGVQENETTDISTGNMPTTNNVYVGTLDGSAPFGSYTVGEVLLFNRALSAQEIKDYYTQTRGRYGV